MPLDVGVGIFLAIGVSSFFSIPLSTLLVVFGIACALLPDIDIVTMAFGKWRHREYTHYPIVYIPLVVLAFLSLSKPYAILFALGVTSHLIHDTFGIGWGIAWLWPFSGRKFLLFPERARRRVLGKFVTWRPEQEMSIRNRHYEGGSSNWVRDFYFRPNVLGGIEYSVLLLSIIALLIYVT